MQSQVWLGVLHTVTSGHIRSPSWTFITAVQRWAQAMHAVDQSVATMQCCIASSHAHKQAYIL